MFLCLARYDETGHDKTRLHKTRQAFLTGSKKMNNNIFDSILDYGKYDYKKSMFWTLKEFYAEERIALCDDIPKMMANALEWINETEKVIQALPDTNKEKSVMLDMLNESRIGVNENNPVKAVLFYPIINEIYVESVLYK